LDEAGSTEPTNSLNSIVVGDISSSASGFLDMGTPTREAQEKMDLSKTILMQTRQSGSHFLIEYQEANAIQS
jgi:hypothetical protein